MVVNNPSPTYRLEVSWNKFPIEACVSYLIFLKVKNRKAGKKIRRKNIINVWYKFFPEFTFVLSLNLRPCLTIILWKDLLTSLSIPIPPTCPRNSTAVTCTKYVYSPIQIGVHLSLCELSCEYKTLKFICNRINSRLKTDLETDKQLSRPFHKKI